MSEKKYKSLIIFISVFLPVAVAALFGIRIPNVEPLSFLPPIYASINALTAILLVLAVLAIKKDYRIIHERLMKTCLLLSVLFLLMYIAYHMTSDPTPFGGADSIKYIYFFILISHILISIAIIPLVLITTVRALTERFDKHKKLAKITFPLWLYVAISGVVVYLMISPYYSG
jgi:putative membrane protein